MTTIHDIPRDIMHKILISNGLDVLTICNMATANKEISSVVKEYWCDIICSVFQSRFPEFCKRVDFTYVFDSDVNLQYLYVNLENIEKVSKMKKSAKYQHLLKNLYNGKMLNESSSEDKQILTLRVLMDFYDYVKEVYDINDQIHKKTNLNVWALYPLIDYIALTISMDETQKSVFRNPDMYDTIVGRIYLIKQELRSVTNCSTEIRLRLSTLLGYLCFVFGIR